MSYSEAAVSALTRELDNAKTELSRLELSRWNWEQAAIGRERELTALRERAEKAERELERLVKHSTEEELRIHGLASLTALDCAKEALEDAEADLEQLRESIDPLLGTCNWCGARSIPIAAAPEHMRACVKHPLGQALAERDAAQKELGDLLENLDLKSLNLALDEARAEIARMKTDEQMLSDDDDACHRLLDAALGEGSLATTSMETLLERLPRLIADRDAKELARSQEAESQCRWMHRAQDARAEVSRLRAECDALLAAASGTPHAALSDAAARPEAERDARDLRIAEAVQEADARSLENDELALERFPRDLTTIIRGVS